MSVTQITALVVVLLSSAFFSGAGLWHSKRGNTNRETPWLLPWGAFVWADAAVLGLFWMLATGLALWLQDWLLFWLIYAVFWVVRSHGEIIYWFNEQFATHHRNPPEKFWLFRFFPNDSVWFVLQLGWQCTLVVSIIASAYLFFLWLPS